MQLKTTKDVLKQIKGTEAMKALISTFKPNELAAKRMYRIARAGMSEREFEAWLSTEEGLLATFDIWLKQGQHVTEVIEIMKKLNALSCTVFEGLEDATI